MTFTRVLLNSSGRLVPRVRTRKFPSLSLSVLFLRKLLFFSLSPIFSIQNCKFWFGLIENISSEGEYANMLDHLGGYAVFWIFHLNCFCFVNLFSRCSVDLYGACYLIHFN